MRWIKNGSLVFGILCLAVLLIAWGLKSFTLMVLALAFSLCSVGMQFVAVRLVLAPIIAVLFSLFLLEGIMGQFLGLDLPYHDPQSAYSLGYSSPVYGFGYRPNPGSYNSRKLFADGEILYDVVYSIGDDGYRQELAPAPFDAYIFGGSFTFGEGLNDDETLSWFLLHEHGINVKSVGVHGYGLHQALYNIKNGITSVDGVNILLTAPWHAIRSACRPSWVAGTFRYYANNNVAILDGVCPGGYLLNRILNKSRVYGLLLRVLNINLTKITDEGIELYLAIINTIYQESLRNNSSLVIAYIDATDEELSSTSWTNETLIERLNELSDSVVDVTLADKVEQLSEEFYLHVLDTHPSASANQARANLIAEYLR
jgi:hypothetical protein